MRSGSSALPITATAACTALACTLLSAVLPWRDASAATLVVPTDFATIQDAIDAASPLDEVLVEPGVYAENLILRSEIDVRGREAARTFLEPENPDEATVTIATVNDVQLSNFTLFESAIAVDVALSDEVVIANVIFDTASDIAIVIDLSSMVDVTNNVFFANTTAILRDSIDVDITNNIFASNDETLATQNPLVDLDGNVAANCWFDNADLFSGGADTAYGTDAAIGDPLFVDIDVFDFHLQEGSPCIDIGLGTDVIDGTDADAGAYGGEHADARPFPVAVPTLTDTSTASPDAANLLVEWSPNLSYRVTHSTDPGGYRIYYDRDESGPPYDGTDAGGGTEPSPIEVTADATSYALSDLMPGPAAPGATQLLAAEPGNAAVTLTWETVPGANDYRVHYGVASTDENQIDTGNVTTFTVTGLTNGEAYRFAVSALARAAYYVAVTAVDSTAQHESVFSEEVSIDLGAASAGPVSNELTALPEFVQPYPVLPDDGECFIATAAYGADWRAEVQVLRDFRDEYLLTHAPGRWLVDRYYALSPPLADSLRGHDTARAVVRWMLTPFVAAALFLLGSSMATKSMAGGLVAGLAVLVARRRSAQRRPR